MGVYILGPPFEYECWSFFETICHYFPPNFRSASFVCKLEDDTICGSAFCRKRYAMPVFESLSKSNQSSFALQVTLADTNDTLQRVRIPCSKCLSRPICAAGPHTRQTFQLLRELGLFVASKPKSSCSRHVLSLILPARLRRLLA